MEYHDRLADGIVKKLLVYKFSVQHEKIMQIEIEMVLKTGPHEREYRLDGRSVIDFFIEGVGIEVKIKGSRADIFRQCERYCKHEQIKAFILVTNRAMGFPNEISGKPCYLVNISKAWL